MKKARCRKWLAVVLSLALALSMLPGAAFAEEVEPPAEETLSCQLTEGCTLEQGHEGECVLSAAADQTPGEPEQEEKNNAAASTSSEPQTDGGEPSVTPEEEDGQSGTPETEMPGTPVPETEPPVQTNSISDTVTYDAGTGAFQVGENSYDNLADAIAAVSGGGAITMTEHAALTADVTIDRDVTLNLNGKTLTTGSYSLKVAGGNVTIRDGSPEQSGTITGTDYIINMSTTGGDKVTLESGTLRGTGWTAVLRVAGDDIFKMTGGTVEQTQSNATTVVQVNARGTASVTGGRIQGGTRGISLAAATSSLTVGQPPAGETQTEAEAGRVYVSGVYASNASASVTLNSGTVGRVFGQVGSGFLLNCWFEQDVSSNLPAGVMCVAEGDHYIVKALTEEDAAAKIGDVYYGSLVKAAASLESGQTLTLLKDYTGTETVKVTVDCATVDLNGHSITNTAEDGYGLELHTSYATSTGNTDGISIVNQGDAVSRITAAVPVYAMSGNSSNLLPVSLGQNIELSSTGADGSCLELGTSACMAYNDTVAGYIKTGGFLATHSDGKQYVHGSFAPAAKNDVNATAVLLNNYEGSIAHSSSNADLTLDLNGHTVTSGSDTVIRLNVSNASLTIKNGTMVTENGTGAEVGIPPSGSTGYNNVTLNLENVDLTAGGSAKDDYGIVCNGTSTGIHINLKGGSVNAPNTIGIYFPAADSTLTIDGTKVTGTMGVAVKGGSVTVKAGSEIKGTGTASDPSEGLNSGVNNTGAALYVEGNYNRDISVKIEGGTFNSDQGLAVKMLSDDSADGEKEIVITGGTFSTDVEEYVYDGLTLVDNDDGTFTVDQMEEVWLNGTSGDDTNTGADQDKAVKTLEHALNLVADDGVIYICGQVTVDSALTVEGATIERAEGYNGTLISVYGADANLTLEHTTIDGNNETVDYGSYLVFITNGGTLNIEEGTELANNRATAVYVNINSNLNMNGGAIRNNTAAQNFGGGGIYNGGTTIVNGGEISGNISSIWGGGILSERGSVTLNGGEIKKNSAEQGAGLTVTGGDASLNGATITENEAGFYGGGIYLQGFASNPILFEMKSGSVVGNTSTMPGAGIFGYVYDGAVDIKISGGSIKDNTITDEEMGSAIGLYGYEGSVAYPRLELSGSPEISGDIFFQNDYEDGYVIHVTGEFTPVYPVEITRSNNLYDIPAVEYAQGLTPNRDDFISGAIFDGFVVKDQYLCWAKSSIVYFYDEDGTTEYGDYRHGVVWGELIDPADVPTPEKTGYTLAGWNLKGSSTRWNFETDPVEGSSTMLVAVWTLNAPTVSVSASDSDPHVGSTAKLTAMAGHDAANVTYTYQWYRDGEALDGETNSPLTVSEAGSFTVEVVASDGAKQSAAVESEALEIIIEDHIFGEWTTVSSPTCTDAGSAQRVCQVCGFTETDRLDPLGHEWEDGFTVDQAPTCTAGGSQSIHCKHCDAVKDSTVIPATGHSFGDDWKSDAAQHWHACTVCGAVQDLQAHTFAWVTDQEASASENGSRHEQCTVCGYAKPAETIPATGTNQPGDTSDATNESTSPKTADDTLPFLAASLLMAACAGLAGVLVYSRKKKRNG